MAGFYIMGRHTSLAWYPTRAAADAALAAILARGYWSGVKPYIEAAPVNGRALAYPDPGRQERYNNEE